MRQIIYPLLFATSILVSCGQHAEKSYKKKKDKEISKAAKKFKIKGEDIVQFIEPIGGCFATDKITVDGEQVEYMYREKPEFEEDSGWRFLSGTETQDYADNPDNWLIYDVNTIINYDKAIMKYIDLPIGTELERIKGTDEFKRINN